MTWTWFLLIAVISLPLGILLFMVILATACGMAGRLEPAVNSLDIREIDGPAASFRPDGPDG
jgi:hypothetical protein